MKDNYTNNNNNFNELHIIYKSILFLFFIFILLMPNNNFFKNKIEDIPEVSEFKNQTLKLFKSSNNYCKLFPRTIFFILNLEMIMK